MRRILHKIGVAGAIVLVGSGLAVRPAQADPIPVTAGNINFLENDSINFNLNVSGNDAIGTLGGTNVVPSYACGASLGAPSCMAGQPVNLSLHQTFTGTDFGDGVSMTVNGLHYAMTALTWNMVAGSGIVPAAPGSVSTPFTFSATATVVTAGGTSGTFDWQGSGTATAGWGTNPFTGAQQWDESNYTFANAVSATPEPASLLLFGTGMTGLLVRRRTTLSR